PARRQQLRQAGREFLGQPKRLGSGERGRRSVGRRAPARGEAGTTHVACLSITRYVLENGYPQTAVLRVEYGDYPPDVVSVCATLAPAHLLAYYGRGGAA